MFLRFNKPSNVFCNAQVRKLGQKLNTKKIGHTGTLDPLASGLLIIATHQDTKLLEYISHTTKTYIAQCQFFYESNSLDNYNNTPQFSGKKEFTKEQLQEAIKYVSAQSEQIPPKLSAKKINGIRAHQLLRENIDFEVKPQKIQIHYLKLLNFDEQNYIAEFEMKISSGGYVRSILRDIAFFLDTTCVMTKLKRIKIGEISLENLPENEYDEIDFQKLINFPTFEINFHQEQKLKNGNEFEILKENGQYLVVKNSQIISVGEVKNNKYYPKKVLLERI